MRNRSLFLNGRGPFSDGDQLYVLGVAVFEHLHAGALYGLFQLAGYVDKQFF